MTNNTTPSQPVDGEGVPELKPCPFCGANGAIYYHGEDYAGSSQVDVGCSGGCEITPRACGDTSPDAEQDEKWAIMVWNARATQRATGPSDDAVQRARAIQLPFPCGCLDRHSAKDVTVEEFTCDTHRAIAAAISERYADMERLQRENELCRRAFETDDLLRIPEVGNLNALQIVRKLAELSDRLATPTNVAEKARRAVNWLRQAGMLLADPTEAELTQMTDIIVAEFAGEG